MKVSLELWPLAGLTEKTKRKCSRGMSAVLALSLLRELESYQLPGVNANVPVWIWDTQGFVCQASYGLLQLKAELRRLKRGAKKGDLWHVGDDDGFSSPVVDLAFAHDANNRVGLVVVVDDCQGSNKE